MHFSGFVPPGWFELEWRERHAYRAERTDHDLLAPVLERVKQLTGHWLTTVLGDGIYASVLDLLWCQKTGITLYRRDNFVTQNKRGIQIADQLHVIQGAKGPQLIVPQSGLRLGRADAQSLHGVTGAWNVSSAVAGAAPVVGSDVGVPADTFSAAPADPRE
jgi:hypothetical protein